MSKGLVRILSAVGIIVFFIIGWYTLISNSAKAIKVYNNYINTARQKASQKLYVDAQENYNKALECKDSIELRTEIAKFYLDSEQNGEYVNFCEQIVEDYPNNGLGYENLSDYYKNTNEYYLCYSTINNAKKRNVNSKVLTEIDEELKYKYEISDVSYDNVGNYFYNLCTVQTEDGYWGMVGAYGTVKLSCVYKKIGNYSKEGLAPALNKDDEFYLINGQNVNKAAIDSSRKIEDFSSIGENKIALKYKGKFHYCNLQLEELFGGYDMAGTFCQKLSPVRNEDKWYVINVEGNKAFDKTFEDIKINENSEAFQNNVAFAKENGKYILINNKGEKISEEMWDDAHAFNGNQPAAVKKGDLWGFVDCTGKMVCDYKFKDAKSFSNNLAPVSNGGRWGYICLDKYEIKIDCEFDDVKSFNEYGGAFVLKDGKWVLIKLYSLSKE